jgi:hypothetical protein
MPLCTSSARLPASKPTTGWIPVKVRELRSVFSGTKQGGGIYSHRRELRRAASGIAAGKAGDHTGRSSCTRGSQLVTFNCFLSEEIRAYRGNEVRARPPRDEIRCGAAPSVEMNAWAWQVPIGGRVRQSTGFARTFRLPRLTLLSPDIVSRHSRQVSRNGRQN